MITINPESCGYRTDHCQSGKHPPPNPPPQAAPAFQAEAASGDPPTALGESSRIWLLLLWPPSLPLETTARLTRVIVTCRGEVCLGLRCCGELAECRGLLLLLLLPLLLQLAIGCSGLLPPLP